MARASNKRLRNQGVQLYFSMDATPTVYTLLGNAADWKGPATTGTKGDGMAYEDKGHEYGIPQSRKDACSLAVIPNYAEDPPVFRLWDIVHFVRVDSNGWGMHVLLQLEAVDRGDRSANGSPRWNLSGETLEDPMDIEPDDLLDFLGLTGTLVVDPVGGGWSITA